MKLAMANDTDVLLKVYDEQRAQARQSEDQRATITNIVLVIASIILGFVSQNGFVFGSLPLMFLLIIIGLYGAIASEKLYERFQFHRIRSSFIRKRLDELSSKAYVLKLLNDADNAHQKEFPRLSRLRLHHLWLSLHIAITITGIVLTVIVVIRNL
jgi:hypothetical protein